MVVLVTTGLLLRSFERPAPRPGFNPEHVLTTRLELPPLRYGTDQRRDQFAEDVLRLSVSPALSPPGRPPRFPLRGWPQLILRLEENPITRPSDAPPRATPELPRIPAHPWACGSCADATSPTPTARTPRSYAS